MRELALNYFLKTIATASDGANPIPGSGSQTLYHRISHLLSHTFSQSMIRESLDILTPASFSSVLYRLLYRKKAQDLKLWRPRFKIWLSIYDVRKNH